MKFYFHTSYMTLWPVVGSSDDYTHNFYIQHKKHDVKTYTEIWHNLTVNRLHELPN